MIAALAPLYVGEFASYRDVLTTRDDARPSLPASQLLQTARLDAIFQRFDPLHTGQDRRALASQWSKYYLVRLIPPVVAAALVLGWRLPLAFEDVEVVLDEQGLPQAFKLPHEGGPFGTPPSDPFQRFGELIDAYLEWFLGEMTKALPAVVLTHGHELLASERRPDGRRNPLFRPVRYVEVSPALRPDGLWRQRRVCCIRYRLEHFEHCDNCPLLDQPPAYVSDL